EGPYGRAEERELGRGRRHRLLRQVLHVRANPRHERERVHGDPLGPEADDALEGRLERRHALVGEAVDEIDVERPEAQLATEDDAVARLVVALDPVDGGLDLLVEVLHAERETVEPEAAEGLEVAWSRDAGIDLDADLGRGVERERLREPAERRLQLPGLEVG